MRLTGYVPMNNVCYIAAAGAGKTQLIINDSTKRYEGHANSKIICIVTFTQHNQYKTIQRVKALYSGIIPKRIIVIGWYKFLMDFIIKPFKGDVIKELYHRHVGFVFNSKDRSIIKTDNGYIRKKCSTEEKYLINGNIDSQNISEFAYKCILKNETVFAQRLEQIFDVIYFDEAQDFCGYDLDIISTIIRSPTDCIIVADPRQHTYSSNNNSKYKKYTGKPDLFIKEKVNTRTKTYIDIDYETLSKSHRCHPAICELASKLYTEYPATTPNIETQDLRALEFDKPQGVFLILENHVDEYRFEMKPLELYWEGCENYKIDDDTKRMNMGESKGDETNAVLIHPTKKMEAWLSKNEKLAEITLSKFYVALTRARYCAGIIVNKRLSPNRFNIPYWKEENIPVQLEIPFSE